jgi:hypothetical protein
MITAKGEEFVRKLKSQEVSLHAVSGRAVADLVASGELGASPTVFRSHASEIAASGAPVTWIPMDLVLLMPVPSVFQSARRIRTQPFS